jgi:hypothetical protein
MSAVEPVETPRLPVWRRIGTVLHERAYSGLLYGGVSFFFVACTFTYYGQLNRDQSGDTYGTIYTAVAIVQKHTIWLDQYLPYLQQHAGKAPYMVTQGPHGHLVNRTPTASSILALPVVAVFTALGVKAQNWHAWMEAGMLTAALTAAATVAVMFVLLTRLTTRRRAALIAATFAWGTLEWGISGQALWQHGGASLALAVALLALVDRRLVLAGAAIAAMVAFRLSTPIIAIFLLPLVGRRLSDWGRFLLGTTPFVLPLAVYNWAAFGSPLHQGYGTQYVNAALDFQSGLLLRGTSGLLVSPGRGLFVYSPVLLFAIVGVVRGRRWPLYPLCALAAGAYVVAAANSSDWYGGQSFGARRVTDALPLLAVLLVPAVDGIVRTKWLRAYVVLLGWSVFVEVLAATGWPPGTYWFDRHPEPIAFSRWWSLTDNELVAMLQTPGIAFRLLEMVFLLVGGILLGYLATFVAAGVRRPSTT